MIYRRTTTESITIKDLFDRLKVDDAKNQRYDLTFQLKIKTPYGYKNIKSMFRTPEQISVTTYFKNNVTLKTSEDHLLKANGEWKKVKDITEADVIETSTGTTSIVKKCRQKAKYTRWKMESLYDVSVEDVHCYYANGIVSHNSWILARFGAEAMKQGRNVLHVTLELNENYVGMRYDAYFTGTPFQRIRENTDRVKKTLEKISGKLFIKYFPLRTVSATSIKLFVERLQLLTQTKVDMLVVDYADILRPLIIDQNANKYNEAGSVYEELRSVAGELQIPVWSASQTNRGGHKAEIVSAGEVADSYRKIMTGDFIVSLSRMEKDKQDDTGRILIVKNRFGPDGLVYPCRFNASTGHIALYDRTSSEGIELLKKMEQADVNAKKSELLKYRRINGNGGD